MRPMSWDKIIGKKIILKLTDDAVNEFKEWDIKAKNLVVFISGVEQNGLWLRHPNFGITFTKDKNGNNVPEDKRMSEEIEADIFIPWGYIKGMVHLCDARLEYGKELVQRAIGFNAEKREV